MNSSERKSDPLLTRTQAAEYLNIKTQTLAAWACNKRYPLPMVKIGRTVRYKLSELERFIAMRTADLTN